jgi:hypothetical protein
LHYTERRSTESSWRPHRKAVGPVSHDQDKLIGVKKIISYYTVVKPKSERVHFIEKPAQRLDPTQLTDSQKEIEAAKKLVRDLDNWEELKI